jgi:TetR/AcrR family transcriptional regulator, transcriptional repressor of bet genes
MPRPSNTEARRSEIVTGLRKVMARRGYEGASVAEIARAAGLASGLVHYHFNDKREILLALLDQLAREASQRAQRALARAGESPLERLEAYLDAFLSREADPDPEAVACWVAIGAEAVRDAKVRKAFGAALGMSSVTMEGLVIEALVAKGRGTPEAKVISAALHAAIQGYLLVSVTAPELIPPGSAAGAVRRLARMLIQGAQS